MKVEQIAIFLENKSGRLSEITGVLADNNINIRSLSLVDKVEVAERALKASGFTVGKANVVAVEVPDRVGGLASVLKVLEKAMVNVEYMYAFVNKSCENAVMIFRFEETDDAIRILQDAGITILSGAQICAL